MHTLIIPERLASVKELHAGSHQDENQMCAMEAVSWITGEEWSDKPKCVDPVIASFMRNWNDDLEDSRRAELLLPLLPLVVGTNGSKDLQLRRSVMVANWLIGVCVTTWLKKAGLHEHAEKTASFPDINEMETNEELLQSLVDLEHDMLEHRDVVRRFKRDLSYEERFSYDNEVWLASNSSARLAALAPAAVILDRLSLMFIDDNIDLKSTINGIVTDAMSLAFIEAHAKFHDTVRELQESAVDLVKRMCALTD